MNKKNTIFEKVTLKHYRLKSNLTNTVLIIFSIFFSLIVAFLFFENRRLVDERMNNIYVMQDNEIYEAKKQIELTEAVIDGLIRVGFSYLFNHDEYNLDDRLEKAKFFFDKKDYNYILTKFNKSNENYTLLELYQTYGGRMNYEIEEIKYLEDKTFLVKGKRVMTFQDVKPNYVQEDMEVDFHRVEKNEVNMYGFIIKNIKVLDNE